MLLAKWRKLALNGVNVINNSVSRDYVDWEIKTTEVTRRKHYTYF